MMVEARYSIQERIILFNEGNSLSKIDISFEEFERIYKHAKSMWGKKEEKPMYIRPKVGDEIETYHGYKGEITGKCELDNIICRTYDEKKGDCSAKHCWALCDGKSWEASEEICQNCFHEHFEDGPCSYAGCGCPRKEASE